MVTLSEEMRYGKLRILCSAVYNNIKTNFRKLNQFIYISNIHHKYSQSPYKKLPKKFFNHPRYGPGQTRRPKY